MLPSYYWKHDTLELKFCLDQHTRDDDHRLTEVIIKIRFLVTLFSNFINNISTWITKWSIRKTYSILCTLYKRYGLFVCFFFAWWYLTPLNGNFQQYFSYIVAVGFIGGVNRRTRRKPPTCRKSLTNVVHLALIEIRTNNISGERHLIA